MSWTLIWQSSDRYRHLNIIPMQQQVSSAVHKDPKGAQGEEFQQEFCIQSDAIYGDPELFPDFLVQ